MLFTKCVAASAYLSWEISQNAGICCGVILNVFKIENFNQPKNPQQHEYYPQTTASHSIFKQLQLF